MGRLNQKSSMADDELPNKEPARRSMRVAEQCKVIKEESCDDEPSTVCTPVSLPMPKNAGRKKTITPGREQKGNDIVKEETCDGESSMICTPAARSMSDNKATRKRVTAGRKRSGNDIVKEETCDVEPSTICTTVARSLPKNTGTKKMVTSIRKRRRNDIFEIAIKDEPNPEKYKLEIGSAFLGEWIINGLLEESDVELIYAVSPMQNPDENALLRCVPTSYNFGLLKEASFLNKMSTRSVSYMFNELINIDEVEVIDRNASFTYLITSVKNSCPVAELCKDFDCSEQRIKTCSTVFADIIDIIEVTCRFGYVLNELTLDDFSYDIFSRRVFLSNRRHVSIGWERLGVPAVFKEKLQVSWKGLAIYAPYSYHLKADNPITEADCVESMFYLYLDLLGLLPWSKHPSLMVQTKRKWYETAKLSFGNLCSENVFIALSRFWREYCRGSRVVINRDSSLKNGELSLRRPFPLDSQKERVIPRACMLNYTVLHKELIYLAESVAVPSDVLNKEMIKGFTETEEAILENVKLRNTVQGLHSEYKSLAMEAEFRLRYHAEMDFHQGKNAVIIERHIRGLHPTYVEVKDEPEDDYPCYSNWYVPQGH